MKDVNKIILIGRLGNDPIRRETKAGKAVVHFPLATSRKFREDGEGQEETLQEETQWHRVVAWGRQGEVCAQYLKKGHPVYVEGMVKTNKFTGEDGETRYFVEVHAENVSFLGGAPRTDAFGAAALN